MFKRILYDISNFLSSLFFTVRSLSAFAVAILLLIAHFVFGISIWWFRGYVILWVVICLFMFLFFLFARQCPSETPKRQNKNPYSKTTDEMFKKPKDE